MAEIRRHPILEGYNRSNMIIKPPVEQVDKPINANHHELHSDKAIKSQSKTSTTTISSSRRESTRTRARFYIDELGFYRHLDPDQRQYVCSNLNSVRSSYRSSSAANSSTAADASHSRNGNPTKTLLAGGDGGYEICFHSIRNDLGISHFDRTVGYEEWKQDWDEFMRAKLIKQEPVTLNRELKTRVRSGIPHDYRCKVWTGLIRMRTKAMRAAHGEDIYQILLRDYVRKVDIPEYRPDSDCSDNNQDSNNNPAQGRQQQQQHRRLLQAAGSNSRPPGSKASSSTSSMTTSNRPALKEATTRQNHTRPNSLIATQIEATTAPANIPEPFIEKCFKQIELDLLRTLPNNRHFEDPNSRGIRRVRNVLRAYACFNPTVGYCQGMNRLAAMALLVLPEEEAFWCLVAIIQCIMPKDYYLKPWLAQVDCCVLSDLLEKKMPKLHKHLVKNDIQLTLFTWFFTIFVDGFRPELMLRIWDCFLLEGDKVLFRIALAILNICQSDLLRMHDFSTMSSHLSRLVSTRKLDMEQLFETFSTMNPLSSGLVQSRRDYHRNRMQLLLHDDD